MPITPFHFGPGAALHAVAPRHVSFLAFCAANIVMDVEPLYYMATDQFPLHRFFHTYVGASIILVATLALFIGVLKLASLILLPNIFGWKQLTIRQAAIGAALGSYSHIVFDSLMHADMQPFWPFSEGNPLLRVVSLGTLHWMCLVAGVLGLVILGIRKALSEETKL
jgi:membrane-bound metal-dependent hydrolase YbcI (DUF457 family)